MRIIKISHNNAKTLCNKRMKKLILWITNQKFVFKNTRKIFYSKILNKKYILNKKAREIEYIEGRKMVSGCFA